MLIVICLPSCKQNKRRNESNKIEELYTISIKKNELEAIPIDRIFAEYKFISLEATDSSLVGSTRKVTLKNDVIYVSDGKCLHQFTTNGKHLRTLERSGGGPQEYVNIWDFTISDKEILIWDQNSRKLIRYSLDNTYINSYKFDNFTATLYPIDTNKILFSSSYQGNDEFKFIIRDLETMDIIESFHPINKAQTTYRHFMNQDNYYVYKNVLLFHEPMNNYIFEISHDESNPVRYIDIYGQNPPETFWEQEYEHVGQINDIAQSEGYRFGTPLYAESDAQIVFSFRRDKSFMLCSYLKSTKESIQSEKILLFQNIPAIEVRRVIINTNSEESFLLAIESEAFYKDTDNNIPYSKELSYLLNNGNPVICIAKLK